MVDKVVTKKYNAFFKKVNMRIIFKKTIVDFYSQKNYKDSKKQLEAWSFEVNKDI